MSRASHRLTAGTVAGVAMMGLFGSIAPSGPYVSGGSEAARRIEVPAVHDDSRTIPTQRAPLAARARFQSSPKSPLLRDEAPTKTASKTAQEQLTQTASKTAQEHLTQSQPAAAQRGSFTATGVKTTGARLRVYTRPRWSSPSRTVAARNPINQRLVFLVNRTAKNGRWLRILLPERPNGSTGWVRSGSVEEVRLHQRIVVDLSDRSLKHFRRGRLVNKFVVGIGTRATPTPKGTFYVWARLPQPEPTGPYGNYVLGLSGFSPVLVDWPGGGRSAVHGTSQPADRGQAVSHGCVRVYNADMGHLKRVPMGTPVLIRK